MYGFLYVFCGGVVGIYERLVGIGLLVLWKVILLCVGICMVSFFVTCVCILDR